jgi:hypothetical protein
MSTLNSRALACVAKAILLLAAAPSMLHAASRSARADILSGIYREAVKGATSDWLEPNRRGQYLSKSLAALWATADAKKPPEDDAGAIDFDFATDTNALELERFNIRTEEIIGSTARLAVSLDYKKPYVRKDPAIVTYDFVRENGRWRIDNIRTDKWSVRVLLRRWLMDP